MKDNLEPLKIIITLQRELLELSSDADEETNALKSYYISKQKNLIWMYSAYLN